MCTKRLVALFVIVALLILPAHAVARGDCPNPYVVKPGDTLGDIAWRCGMTVSALRAANGLLNPNQIWVGQALVIPAGSTGPSGSPGIAGPPGQGAAAITGYERAVTLSSSVHISPDSTIVGSVRCATDRKVLGGGALIQSPPSALVLQYSGPSGDSGWTAQWHYDGESSATLASVEISAICADVLAPAAEASPAPLAPPQGKVTVNGTAVPSQQFISPAALPAAGQPTATPVPSGVAPSAASEGARGKQLLLEFHRGPTTLQDPVEQWTPGGMTQPDRNMWVWNKTESVWDPDDVDRLSTWGYLDGGASVTGTLDIMADMDAHMTIVLVRADSDITSTLRFVNDAGELRSWERQGTGVICVMGPDYRSWSPALEVIESSRSTDGQYVGKAALTTLQVTVTNSDSKRVRNIGVDVFVLPTFIPSESFGCPASSWNREGFDPMWWWATS